MSYTRKDIETWIEDLITLLDSIDGDPDLEDGGDHEPWLSTGVIEWNATYCHEDREKDKSDWEPWLSTGIINWNTTYDFGDTELDPSEKCSGAMIFGGNENQRRLRLM